MLGRRSLPSMAEQAQPLPQGKAGQQQRRRPVPPRCMRVSKRVRSRPTSALSNSHHSADPTSTPAIRVHGEATCIRAPSVPNTATEGEDRRRVRQREHEGAGKTRQQSGAGAGLGCPFDWRCTPDAPGQPQQEAPPPRASGTPTSASITQLTPKAPTAPAHRPPPPPNRWPGRRSAPRCSVRWITSRPIGPTGAAIDRPISSDCEQRAVEHLGGRRARQALDGQRIAVDAEADDDAGRRRRQVRVVAEGLARMHVADVHLDHRHARAFDRVVQRHAGVGVGTGVEDQAEQCAGRDTRPRPRGSSRSARPRDCSAENRWRGPGAGRAAAHRVRTSSSVVWPYTAGSRVPSRFRLGPFRTRIDVIGSPNARRRKYRLHRCGLGVSGAAAAAPARAPHGAAPARPAIRPNAAPAAPLSATAAAGSRR